MTTAITLDEIDRITGGRLGIYDVACPLCGSERRSAVNRRRPVMRVWRLEEGFGTYHCARCGEKGHSREPNGPAPDPIRLAAARKAAEERELVAVIERLDKARWLWSQRKPIAGTIAGTYLREARGCYGPIPSTLAFLPPRGDHGPAMITAFGLADEPEPGRLVVADDAVRGVHLTRLLPDGSDRERGDGAKIMIGRSAGWPIVVAPPNDFLGLAVTEGVEDALSVHESTGLGAWAAGCAARLPALAGAMPAYMEAITIMVDDDPEGRRHAGKLAELLGARGVEVRRILTGRAP
jgi:hypothetical protein